MLSETTLKESGGLGHAEVCSSSTAKDKARPVFVLAQVCIMHVYMYMHMHMHMCMYRM